MSGVVHRAASLPKKSRGSELRGGSQNDSLLRFSATSRVRAHGRLANQIMIRDAHVGEVDAIVDLLLASYAEYAPAPGDPIELSWHAYRRELADVRGRWPIAQHLVASENATLLGTATFFPEAWLPQLGEDGWPEGYAGIRLLAVHPSARGKGLGRALTEECIERARALEREWIGLHTTQLMKVARGMYERMGFERFAENDIPIRPDFTVVAYRLALT